MLGGGGVYCLFSQPGFPIPKYRSAQEQIIHETKFNFGLMRDNANVLQEIWDKKLLHVCDDFESIEDLKEAISTPESYEDITGVLKFKDHRSNVVNTRNGIRITTNQPKISKRSIFLVGLCATFGVGAEDSKTVASYLQRKLNEFLPEEGFIVYNYGYFVGSIEEGIDRLLPLLSTLPVKKDDLVFIRFSFPLCGIPYCDLTFKSKRPHNYGDIFLDMGHYTANGNRMIADGLFDFMQEHDFFRNATMTITHSNKAQEENHKTSNENELLTKYKQELADFYKENIQPKVGAIVMNANPFTYGHRYLVEAALKECDYLIVFVVEEDKSELPFEDRFSLVKENLSDLKRVFVRKSGEFIISAKTFSEYFRKESLQDQKIDTTLDVTLFAKEIAPVLNISVRFAGKEPTDSVTRQYNEDMARILPQYGINFIELERAKNDNGEIISASTVRSLTKSGEFEKLKDFAPPATVRYLMKMFDK